MISVRCTVSEWDEDDGEGSELVVARLVDVDGNTHEFVDEAKRFFVKAGTDFPAEGRIVCTVVSEDDRNGEPIATIDTSQPNDLFAEGSGESRFNVLKSALTSPRGPKK